MAPTLIIETESVNRKHRSDLKKILKQNKDTIRIASAYVTDTDLLSHIMDRDVRLLTYISKKDIIVGASSLNSLTTLIKAGVQCRYISKGPRLHAKVYIFGNQTAVVTSANLTQKALGQNIEVGVRLSGDAATKLIDWFDTLWWPAETLDLEIVAKWFKETKAERAAYSALQKKIEKEPALPTGKAAKLIDLFNTGNRFFVCNTNRVHSREDEKLMRDRGYATAWEPFNYPRHMGRVEAGNAIFMYAKGVGIVGVGRATGPCHTLERGNPDRINQGKTREWRVPTDWLFWKMDSDACPWKSPQGTFFEVGKGKHRQVPNDVKKHFLNP